MDQRPEYKPASDCRKGVSSFADNAAAKPVSSGGHALALRL